MIRCGPNIYAHMYLEETGQLTDVVQPKYDASIARMEECKSSLVTYDAMQ